MTDKIITDDEKEALLDGVANGAVEVHSNTGPVYAEVTPFEIPERSRLTSNSFPRLQRLNERVASSASKLVEQLVSAETEITPTGVETSSYGEFTERNSSQSVMVEFSAAPLEGSGLIVLGGKIISHLVEAFYGGTENETPAPVGEYFTRGEVSVASLFGKTLTDTLADVWRPLMETEHKQVTTHQNTDIVEGFETGDNMVVANFSIEFLKQTDSFTIAWPISMIGPLLPVFEGQKRERDPVQDALWERSLRSRLTDSIVGIASHVGHNRMTLGAVAELAPGDVIDIDDPTLSTVFVKQVPILKGQFGVHEGKYSVEATNWLGPQTQAQA